MVYSEFSREPERERLDVVYTAGTSQEAVTRTPPGEEPRRIAERGGEICSIARAILRDIGFSEAFVSIYTSRLASALVGKMAYRTPYSIREGEVISALTERARRKP